jgi:uncharacterized protein (DUF697 family)
MVPGIGTITGGAISAVVATSLTNRRAWKHLYFSFRILL